MAKELSTLYGIDRVWLFEGTMGSGKTTLIKALAEELGFAGAVQSPTYSLINEYELPLSRKIIHMDLYRINSIEEAFEAGVWDYLKGNDYCFIEWPEIIRPWVGEPVINCYLSSLNDTTRLIELIKR